MTQAVVGASSERVLLARIRARLGETPSWLRVGIGDDAAIIEPPRNAAEAITTDSLVEGVHFDRTFVPADAIGHRALAVNLSDLAAMGAAPRGATLSLMLPADLPLDDFDALLGGFDRLARTHNVTLVGGNLSQSPGPLVVDVMAFGTVHRRKVLTRAGARPGDAVYVSGTLGAARAGLSACRAQVTGIASSKDGPGPVEASVRDRYLRPEPRVRLGMLLGRTGTATACMDLSDGLADALDQVSVASGVGMNIDADRIPVDEATRSWFSHHDGASIDAALTGGDDYELLFTVPPRRRGRLRGVARLMRNLPLTQIGTVTRGQGVRLVRAGREEPLPRGFSHFAGE
jgi:thiamine-monophosphate kinase